MDKPEPVSTSNTALAAFLLYHEHNFQGFVQDKHDSRRRIFVFIKMDGSDELIKDFEAGNALVDPKRYQSKLKQAFNLLSDRENRA